jgi:Cytidylate kinase-like family
MNPRTDDRPPLHGYRGDSTPELPPMIRPRGITLAISREVGSRGGTVARQLGERLGWQVFDQESLDFLVRDSVAREELHSDLPLGAKEWADYQWEKLQSTGTIGKGSSTGETVKLMLALAARGETIIVGRGAGFVLPNATTLHVRIIANPKQRIAYMADLLRMTPTEAAAEVARRDSQRANFLANFQHSTSDPTGYDLVMNSTRLGVEAVVTILAQAVRDRLLTKEPAPESPETVA